MIGNQGFQHHINATVIGISVGMRLKFTFVAVIQPNVLDHFSRQIRLISHRLRKDLTDALINARIHAPRGIDRIDDKRRAMMRGSQKHRASDGIQGFDLRVRSEIGCTGKHIFKRLMLCDIPIEFTSKGLTVKTSVKLSTRVIASRNHFLTVGRNAVGKRGIRRNG